ncbi:mitochondrial outer membrane protein porin 4-like [Aristolochia californica]|uniref:mitochondrial outer membrane protein porin 4-like n=1 Tax=Aristolochia californica TaxID=171875 RepID=UPI0035E03D49
MGSNGPAPFSEIGKKARDLLNKDYNFDHKFNLTLLSGTGLGLVTTAVQKDQLFVGDVNTQYKTGNTTVDVKVDSSSNVSTTIAVNEIVQGTRAALSFKLPDHKSSKLDVLYLHPHAAVTTSIGLTNTPLLEFSTAIGTRQISLGAEVGFDTKSGSLTKYNAGIGYNTDDLSASLILGDKGETLKASYIHIVNPFIGTAVAAEMTHKFTTYENSFSIGSSHSLDPFSLLKTRFAHNGKVAMIYQREWRPKSLVTFSAEYDTKVVEATPKFGLALALKP